MMTECKGKKSLVPAVAVFLSLLIVGGCTSIKYSYDTGTGYSGVENLHVGSGISRLRVRTPLLETNVQVLADQLLGQKGFTKVREKPDLLISIHTKPNRLLR